MKWIKRGLIFNCDNCNDWAVSGAMLPIPIHLNEKTIRVFLTFLDRKGIGRPGFVDLNKNKLSEVQNISQLPIFNIGEPGTFDENGCLTCSVTQVSNGDYYFYYAGFELGTKIRYRLLAGLSITNNKFELKRKFETPILERSSKELYFRAGPFCLFEDNKFKLWYVAGSDWMKINGKSMPVYEIKYLESADGIKWDDEGKLCIKIEKANEHGFGRPYVINNDGKYKMFYSIRIKQLGYRLGYAESNDGQNWIRKDDLLDLDVSSQGFDDNMICYSSVMEIEGKLIMFYNGNAFGKTGFGYAELITE